MFRIVDPRSVSSMKSKKRQTTPSKPKKTCLHHMENPANPFCFQTQECHTEDTVHPMKSSLSTRASAGHHTFGKTPGTKQTERRWNDREEFQRSDVTSFMARYLVEVCQTNYKTKRHARFDSLRLVCYVHIHVCVNYSKASRSARLECLMGEQSEYYGVWGGELGDWTMLIKPW